MEDDFMIVYIGVDLFLLIIMIFVSILFGIDMLSRISPTLGIILAIVYIVLLIKAIAEVLDNDRAKKRMNELVLPLILNFVRGGIVAKFLLYDQMVWFGKKIGDLDILEFLAAVVVVCLGLAIQVVFEVLNFSTFYFNFNLYYEKASLAPVYIKLILLTVANVAFIIIWL